MCGGSERAQVSLRSREKSSGSHHKPAQGQERGPWQQEEMAGKRDGQSQEGQEPSPGPKGKLQEMAGGWGFVEGRREGGSQMR